MSRDLADRMILGGVTGFLADVNPYLITEENWRALEDAALDPEARRLVRADHAKAHRSLPDCPTRSNPAYLYPGPGPP